MKAIPGFPGYYATRDGHIFSTYRGKLHELKHWKHNGYFRVATRFGQHPVHRLVMFAYVGPCPAGHEVLHYDGDKQNNNLSNLRYGTRKENMEDMRRHGRIPHGENHYNAKLTEQAVNDIRSSTECQRVLAKRYGVSQPLISLVRNNSRWT